ncbi:MAG: hypothetical protein ITF98_09680 [Fermentimonas sp.]|nr:hypothetical protein [Fermentimonas sp.]
MRKNYLKAVLLSLFLVLITVNSISAQNSKTELYPTVKFDGTLKNKYEYAIDNDLSRFSVRNSRVGVSGNVNHFAGYRAQLELSDEGDFKVLDLSGIIRPAKGLTFTFGQTSIPLFNSYVVSPSDMMFANRTFLGKYFLSTRDLGLNAKYKFNAGVVPTNLEFGVYNGNAINDPVWKSNLSYGGRVELGSMDGLRFTAKFYDYPKSDSLHFLIYGADLRYEKNNFKIETEVMKKESRTDFNGDLLSYYIQTAYKIPLKSEYFDYLLPAVRWDAIDERFDVNGFDVNRLTLGLGLNLAGEKFDSIIRLDYEWYAVNNSMSIFNANDQMDSDKITVELLLTF